MLFLCRFNDLCTCSSTKVYTRDTSLRELVRTDFCGPVEAPSVSGARYFRIFVDDYPKWEAVYPMPQMPVVNIKYLCFEKIGERQSARRIRTFRSDRGGELISPGLTNQFRALGIRHEPTTPYAPHQNWGAQLIRCTLLSLNRAMTEHKQVNKAPEAEALLSVM